MRLTAALKRRRGGLFRLSARLDAGAAEAAAAAAGHGFVRTDVSLAQGKAGLIRAVARALSFPDWFGGNWDALQDAASDLSWLPAGGYVLLLDGAEGPEGASPEDWATLTEVLASAAEGVPGDGRRLFVLVRGGGRPRLPVVG
jgi:hypothetical protein